MKNEDITITLYDCETGGLDPKTAQITEIALINFDLRNFKVNWEYQTYIKPYGGLEIDEKSMAKSGVTMKDVENGKESSEVVKDLIKLFEESNKQQTERGRTITAGHNVISFDSKFLETLFKVNKQDVYKYINREIHDTIIDARKVWGGEEDGINLTACCKRIGVRLIGAHNAMNDVRATFELYKYFTNRMRNAELLTKNKNGDVVIKTHRKYFNF